MSRETPLLDTPLKAKRSLNKNKKADTSSWWLQAGHLKAVAETQQGSSQQTKDERAGSGSQPAHHKEGHDTILPAPIDTETDSTIEADFEEDDMSQESSTDVESEQELLQSFDSECWLHVPGGAVPVIPLGLWEDPRCCDPEDVLKLLDGEVGRKFLVEVAENRHPPKENKITAVGSRLDVWQGRAWKTGGGLKKEDLKLNARGRLVSRRLSDETKRSGRIQRLAEWNGDLRKAREAMKKEGVGVKGVLVKRGAEGTKLYDRACQFRGQKKTSK